MGVSAVQVVYGSSPPKSALYLEDGKILLFRNPNSNGSTIDNYVAASGVDAEEAFKLILDGDPKAKRSEIMVSFPFYHWAKGLALGQRPTKRISDILYAHVW